MTLLIAFFWGFAEATFFFLVPDVWLSFVALDASFRPVLDASFAALAGALSGGLWMWIWGRNDPKTAGAFLARVPAIGEKLVATVASQIASRGMTSMFIGPLRGIPYKIYAVEAGARRHSVVTFLLVSIPARYVRFFLAAGAFWLAGKAMPLPIEGKRAALAAFWILFYILYFRRMRPR